MTDLTNQFFRGGHRAGLIPCSSGPWARCVSAGGRKWGLLRGAGVQFFFYLEADATRPWSRGCNTAAKQGRRSDRSEGSASWSRTRKHITVVAHGEEGGRGKRHDRGAGITSREAGNTPRPRSRKRIMAVKQGAQHGRGAGNTARP